MSLQTIETPSKVTRPSFEGSASETTPVVVHVYKGTKVEGAEVASVTVSGTGGPWKSGPISPALADGTYIAEATQESAIGNGPGTSNMVIFEVDTKPPTVALSQPPSPSRNAKPTFTGTASATTKVVVHIYEGSEASGTEVASATATGTGGSWTSSAASPALSSEDRTYTAVATQESPLGNAEGRSNTVTFVVNTEAPKVTLEKLKTPSNDTTPTFIGTSNTNGEVVVHVYEGAKVESGKELTSVTGTASEGKWSAGPATLATTGEHTYTAVAKQASPISGNPEGTSGSVTFVVSKESPKVTLEQPATPSNETTRTFKGTASASTEVVVHVYEGSGTGGTQVAEATAKVEGSGEWVSGKVTLPGGERTYTAIAEQPSPIGNPPGMSKALTFFVNTEPPKVAIVQPETPSNNTTPTLTGMTNAETSVVVHVFEGSSEVASATATPSSGTWSAKVTLPATGERTYTAFATQVSPFKGNHEGKSSTATFLVDKEAPKIVLSPVARSHDTTPSFSGTTNANTEVVVEVFEGTEAKGKEVAKVMGKPSEGKWTSGQAKLTSTGEHVYTALATQVSPFTGNPEGKSLPVTFVVDTLPPAVTLAGPSSRSGNAKPTFTGTANEKQPVTLKIYAGSRVEGTPLTTKTATVENGTWKIGEVALATGKHTYTAVASQPSEIENGIGESTPLTFEIDTEPPTVTLNAVAEVSGDTTPSFSGTTNEAKIVTVKVYEGVKTTGTPIRTLQAQPNGGVWATAAVSPKLGNGTYTAVASQPSSIEGDPEGTSGPAKFEINTEAPIVTLERPISPSKNTTPSFKGTASEATPVTIEVFRGVGTGGEIAAQATVKGTRGAWSSSEVALSLQKGEEPFTAVAIQTGVDNVRGESASVTFVVDTEPPKVTLTGPPSPSKELTPKFSGTSSEGTLVTVSIYEGVAPGGTPVATATATPSDGEWSSNNEKPLQPGLRTFTAVATQPSGIGNGPGTSNVVTFTVDTLSPTVTLNQVASQGDAEPAFSGTASESGPVTVDVYAGSQPGGTPVASVSAVSDGGEWISGRLKQVLENGEYTAVAVQESSLENGPGSSEPVTFVVNTAPPTVVLEAPSAVKNAAATLHASVDPNGGNIGIGLCSFELGTTTSYGRVAQCAWGNGCTFATCSFPSGTSTVPVYASFFELEPSTTYFYRVGAENERGSGFVVGSFTTTARSSGASSAPPPPAPIGPAATGVAASKSASLAAVLVSQLDPSGRGAKIAALLKAGLYQERFKAPEPGTTSIRWYYLPRGAKLAGKGKHAPVLVASGTWRFSAAGVATIKIRLSAKGRHLLSHAKQIRLTATCTFTPPPESKPTAVSRTFELKR